MNDVVVVNKRQKSKSLIFYLFSKSNYPLWQMNEFNLFFIFVLINQCKFINFEMATFKKLTNLIALINFLSINFLYWLFWGYTKFNFDWFFIIFKTSGNPNRVEYFWICFVWNYQIMILARLRNLNIKLIIFKESKVSRLLRTFTKDFVFKI